MPSIGTVWTDRENVSPTKHNAKDWFSGTGAQIAALPVAQEHNFARCTLAGSGFELNRCYFRGANQSTWLPFFPPHVHDSDSEGGTLFDILVSGLKTIYFIDYQNLQASFMTSEKSATSTYADVLTASDKYVQMGTAATVDTYSMCTAGGLTFSFASQSSLYWKQAPSHSIDILVRSGVNMNPVQEAATSAAQYGVELCTGDGTQYQIVSANGVSRTKVPSGMIPTAAARGLSLIHTPGSSVFFKSSTGNTVTKTTNVPSTGSAAPDDVLTFGVRTTNTTIKTLRLWALLFAGKVGDANWVTT